MGFGEKGAMKRKRKILRPIVVEILFSFSFKKKKDWNGKRGENLDMKWNVAAQII